MASSNDLKQFKSNILKEWDMMYQQLLDLEKEQSVKLDQDKELIKKKQEECDNFKTYYETTNQIITDSNVKIRKLIKTLQTL